MNQEVIRRLQALKDKKIQEIITQKELIYKTLQFVAATGSEMNYDREEVEKLLRLISQLEVINDDIAGD